MTATRRENAIAWQLRQAARHVTQFYDQING